MSLIIGKVEHLFVWFVVVQSLNRSRLFLTPWTEACQASLSFTITRILFKQMSIESVMPSNNFDFCCPLLLLPSIFPSLRVLPNELALRIGDQSVGASILKLVLPRNIQDWFPLELTGWIFLQSKELSRVFSSTTVQKHQFFGVQPSLWSISHIHTWLLEKPKPWLDGPIAKQYLFFSIHYLGWS